MHRIPELLAPAGNIESLHAAITAGADAVYLGLDQFNARRNANNFTLENLHEATDYVHLRGASVYVTMNTIILPGELKSALDYARGAYQQGADALIVQDLGLAAKVAQTIPELPLHISTQMNIHDRYGVEACAALGVERITLARELTLAEVADLCEYALQFGIEVEVFAHGALCVCYSGQCFMSSMIGGRSANRGLCAQACRLPYELYDSASPDSPKKAEGEFLLSPKDLCTADMLPQLAEAGVASLKIEGRMKSPEYVSLAVSVYRAVLDRMAKGAERSATTEDERSRLSSVFSRGFTTAYLGQERGNSMMGYQRPNNRGQFIGRVKVIKDGQLHLGVEAPLVPGDVLEFWTRKGNVTFRVPADIEQSRKTAYLPLNDDLATVRQNDRAFRVRSAEAAFADSQFAPRIPVVGFANLHMGRPLEIGFRPATPEEVLSSTLPLEDADTAVAIARRLGVCSLDTGYAKADGPVIEAARSKAITEEDVLAHVDRMGQTPFQLCVLDVNIDEGVGLGFSQIHHCRAAALDELILQLLAEAAPQPVASDAQPSKAAESRKSKKRPAPQDIKACVLATNPECARAAKRAGANVIYVPALNYRRGQSEMAGVLDPEVRQAGFPKQCTLVMPAVDHSSQASCAADPFATLSEGAEAIEAVTHAEDCEMPGELRIGIDAWEHVHEGTSVMVNSLSGLQHALDKGAMPEAGFNLPLTNESSLDVAAVLGIQDVWLSPELNLGQIKDLAKRTNLNLGIKVNGAQELMVTEHCMLMSQGQCNSRCDTCARRKRPHHLKDRKGYQFPVVSDCFGRSHIYNGVQLDAVNALPELIDAGVSSFMIDATLMDPEQTAHATGRLVKAIQLACEDASSLPKLPNTTSGHLFRGVL